MDTFNTAKLKMHNFASSLVDLCKNYAYKNDSINIYCIEDGKILIRNNIPGVTFADIDKAAGSIVIYHAESEFINCKFTLRKECIIVIMPTIYKVNKLSIMNNNGFGSLCYIGKNFSCQGAELRLWEYKNIYIGEDVMFSWNIKLFTSDAHSILNKNGELINTPEDIVINDHVWVGFDVKILKGAFINKNCVIGASSLISKKYNNENIVLTGIPAKIVNTNITWKRERIYRIP